MKISKLMNEWLFHNKGNSSLNLRYGRLWRSIVQYECNNPCPKFQILVKRFSVSMRGPWSIVIGTARSWLWRWLTHWGFNERFTRLSEANCYQITFFIQTWQYVMQEANYKSAVAGAIVWHQPGVVSLTFHELSKIFSRNLCIAEIVLVMKISSWNFVRVP